MDLNSALAGTPLTPSNFRSQRDACVGSPDPPHHRHAVLGTALGGGAHPLPAHQHTGPCWPLEEKGQDLKAIHKSPYFLGDEGFERLEGRLHFHFFEHLELYRVLIFKLPLGMMKETGYPFRGDYCCSLHEVNFYSSLLTPEMQSL